MPPPEAPEVAAALREIGSYLRLLGENRWKAKAYATAAGAVEALGPALPELVASGRLPETPGIGPATAAVITEIFTTGSARRLERLRAELPPGLLELQYVPGMTLPRIRALHQGLGLRNLHEVKEAAREGRLRTVKGFGARTEQKILEGIARHETRPARIRLIDARDVAADLAKVVARLPGVLRVEIAGAVRRWKETVGTLRLVVAAEAPAEVASAFARGRGMTLPRDEAVTARVVVHLAEGIPAELVVVRPEALAGALLQATGAPAHLAALEARAAARGLGWPEALAGAASEREIYARLGLPEIPPELREGAGEIEDASSNDLADLVTVGDVQGMVHCHSTHSDGRASIEEMARAAEERGYRYLTITDHSQAAFYAGGLTVERLERQWEEIAAVQDKVNIKLLRGTESDVLADGALDYPDDVLERLDVIIASVHNRHRLDEDATTRRLVRAMRLPVFKIWGHPLGRLILRRDPVRCHLDEVLEAIAASRAAIEINGDPYRLDLPPEHVREARRLGIPFVISTDAHGVSDLDNLSYGVAMARRGGVRRGEVLNTLPAEAFAAAVRPAAG